MTGAVTLREMTYADLPAVLELEHALFGEEAWTEGMLASELAGVPSGRYYLVADQAGGMAGYAGLLTPGGGQADVLTLAVAEDRWGQGIGAALLDALLGEAGRRGCTRGVPRGAGGQPPGAAAVSAARLRRDRRPARLLPAVRHRRPGDAADLDRPGGQAGPAARPRPARPQRAGAAGRGMGRAVTGPLVLGIETSCDETGAGLVRGHELLADAVASSVAEHARFGGVVPEVASRAHLEAMVPAVDRALATAGVRLADVDAIAVTAGPGLAGALLVGVCAAKAYALALGKPLYAVNHLAAHIAVDQLEHGPLPAPAIALLVSGGHSSLLLARTWPATCSRSARPSTTRRARPTTRWPGCSGCRSRAARRSTRAARSGDPAAIAFPRGKYRDQTYDFSFSGLKTAVARWVEARRAAGLSVPVADVAASFQEAVADVLTRKAVHACRAHGVEHLVIGGGVAANSRLRALAAERCAAAGLRLRVPRPGLCTDNGAMVAALGRGAGRARRPVVRAGLGGRLRAAGEHRAGLTQLA